VAADEGQRPAPARDRDRKVERGYDPDHAQRMPLLDQPVIASFRRDLSAEQLPGLAHGQVADVDDLLDLAAGLAQDLAVLQADEPGQLFLARTKTVTEPAHDLAAVRFWHLPPTRVCLLRLGDRKSSVVLCRCCGMFMEVS